MISKEIPSVLLLKYTMGGNIPVYTWVLDDSNKNVSANYDNHKVQEYRERIKKRECNYYGRTDQWLYEAMGKFPIAGRNILVFGSETPWYEIMALEFGAKSVTVVEYNKRTNFDGVSYVTPDKIGDAQFDCAFSISSFEHDGLGRYGDSLNPYGDFMAMLQAKAQVIHGGLLFLAVPVGKDAFSWNSHRIYGAIRLPMLLQNWDLIASYGFSEADYERGFGRIEESSYHQPIFVLRNC